MDNWTLNRQYAISTEVRISVLTSQFGRYGPLRALRRHWQRNGVWGALTRRAASPAQRGVAHIRVLIVVVYSDSNWSVIQIHRSSWWRHRTAGWLGLFWRRSLQWTCEQSTRSKSRIWYTNIALAWCTAPERMNKNLNAFFGAYVQQYAL